MLTNKRDEVSKKFFVVSFMRNCVLCWSCLITWSGEFVCDVLSETRQQDRSRERQRWNDTDKQTDSDDLHAEWMTPVTLLTFSWAIMSFQKHLSVWMRASLCACVCLSVCVCVYLCVCLKRRFRLSPMVRDRNRRLATVAYLHLAPMWTGSKTTSIESHGVESHLLK